jgi:transposase
VKTKFTEYKKREDFRSFLDGVLADQPQDKQIHVVLDNYSPHKRNDDWLAKFEGRVQFHFTPTSASWLNQIEIVFSLLQRKTLNGGSFKTKISCARPLKPSSKNTTSAPSRSVGGSARSRAASSKIPLLIYAIKH